MSVIDHWQKNLNLANHVRTSNKETKDRLASMPRKDAIDTVIDLIGDPNGAIGGMQIGQLLQAIPFYGEQKMAEILTRAGVFSTPMSPMRKLRSLTDRQRLALTMELWRRQS